MNIKKTSNSIKMGYKSMKSSQNAYSILIESFVYFRFILYILFTREMKIKITFIFHLNANQNDKD